MTLEKIQSGHQGEGAVVQIDISAREPYPQAIASVPQGFVS